MALKWGICSTGKICSDFCSALKTLPSENHQIAAVVSRSQENAQEFATTFDIPNVYSSYEKFAADADINIVYIGSAYTEHVKLSIQMLNAGNHVLCEKPLADTLEDVKLVHKVAQEKNIFYGGHDIDGCIILSYSEGQKACLIYSSKVKSDINCASIIGTNGSIEMNSHFWCPDEVIFLTGKETNEIPVGPVPFNYPNSGGLCYEAEEFRKCINSGKTEYAHYSHKDSEMVHRIMEDVAKQIGRKLPN
ncbi:DHDH [Mytilus edulis]|uniref:Trans-1,2-dihydrobenzene-1,2-diol dehydrogenase n=1 Tax=Mytilus edulis TaxID=6550 RepID=A0A8S3TVG9_MYTED|nr:DHDH [Mytilus edulis]